MFTGIVEELGTVVGLAERARSARLTVRGPLATSDAREGDSIAVNGVCLTVVDLTDEIFSADVIDETLRRSCLGELAEGDAVNLERAMQVGDRFGGHIVQGHVDGTATIIDRSHDDNWEVVQIALPAHLRPYVVEKGSIAVDGVSLTVTAVDGDSFAVALIPTTLARTTLGNRPVGAKVNLETDLVAKYVERMIATDTEVTEK